MKYNYKYCAGGIDAFLDSALDEAMREYPPIIVSVGDHRIEIPMFPESFECMAEWLQNSFDILSEEYEGDF